ncbi:MAG: hypothetical protein HC852_18845 [Acaryochloridaceae cyanobacterium RU_4_10]|nr:hypothetical protein [Acaryochloridaceae cyanobacterium RU_4_10]
MLQSPSAIRYIQQSPFLSKYDRPQSQSHIWQKSRSSQRSIFGDKPSHPHPSKAKALSDRFALTEM